MPILKRNNKVIDILLIKKHYYLQTTKNKNNHKILKLIYDFFIIAFILFWSYWYIQ